MIKSQNRRGMSTTVGSNHAIIIPVCRKGEKSEANCELTGMDFELLTQLPINGGGLATKYVSFETADLIYNE